jgi:hypothetical protein
MYPVIAILEREHCFGSRQPEGPQAFIVSSILDQKRERGCHDINRHIIWLLYEATPQALFDHNGTPKGRPP